MAAGKVTRSQAGQLEARVDPAIGAAPSSGFRPVQASMSSNLSTTSSRPDRRSTRAASVSTATGRSAPASTRSIVTVSKDSAANGNAYMSPRWNSQCASARPCSRARASRNAGADRSTPTACAALGTEQLEQAPRPGADIEQFAQGHGPEFFAAARPPARPGPGRRARRAPSSLAANFSRSPTTTAMRTRSRCSAGSSGSTAASSSLQPSGPRAAGRGAVIDPLLLPKPVQEACLGKQPQVAGNPGLALPHHPADFPYRELTVAQKRRPAAAGSVRPGS